MSPVRSRDTDVELPVSDLEDTLDLAPSWKQPRFSGVGVLVLLPAPHLVLLLFLPMLKSEYVPWI
jgi:hypothetical protein